MRRVFSILFFSGCIIISFNLPAEQGGTPVKELTIIYTANSSGKFKACACPNDQYGGLSERVTLIKSLRDKEKPFLLVDGGNMVSLFGSFTKRGEGVMRVMNLMGYDAAGIGSQELFNGAENAVKLQDAAKFPLLSASTFRKMDGSLFFKPYVIKTVGNSTAGITCIADTSSFSKIGFQKVQDFTYLPRNETMKKVLDELSAQCNFIIVLSQLPPEENTALLEAFPRIDLIVESFGNKRYDPPVVTPNGIIVSPGYNGHFLGQLTLEKSGNGEAKLKESSFLPVLNYPEDPEAGEIVKEYYTTIK